jgi:hypothetical protein
MVDFMQVCPSEIMYDMVIEPVLHPVSLTALQEQFLEQKSWETHKKNIVDNLLHVL